MHYTLGDEQQPANAFVALIAPSDFDKAWTTISNLIQGYHHNDWFDLQLWRETGTGEAIHTFLNNYILMARQKQASPTRDDLAIWKGNYLGKFPGSIGEDVEDYFNALMDAREAQSISDTIFQPWTYAPTTPIEDFQAALTAAAKAAADAAAPAAKSALTSVLVAAVALGAIYLLGKQYIARKL